MVSSKVVIKFGGSDLSTGDRIRNAAELVMKSPYKEKVVVVSAMGKTTDNLVNTMNQIGNLNEEDYAEILSMGERTSARVFCSVLTALGAKAMVFDPVNVNWPIITNSDFRKAKPDMKRTRALVRKFIMPILAEAILVVCGFVGKDTKGHVTTLGRGGSDTTALLLAECLKADEVILVKETTGVLSADPKMVAGARKLENMDVLEMFDLAHGGAKIIQPESLKHKLPGQKLRVVSFESEDLANGGTEITGSLNTNSFEVTSHKEVLAINVICGVNAKNLQRIFSVLRQKPIYGVSSGKRSVTVFTSHGNVHEILNELHTVEAFRAISHRENLALLQIIHPMFIDSPGGVAKISAALSQNGINIVEATTSKATINVFIEESQLKKATEAINHVLKT